MSFDAKLNTLTYMQFIQFCKFKPECLLISAEENCEDDDWYFRKILSQQFSLWYPSKRLKMSVVFQKHHNQLNYVILALNIFN